MKYGEVKRKDEHINMAWPSPKGFGSDLGKWRNRCVIDWNDP